MVLSSEDRCQAKRCDAQAYWSTWVELTELTWCNHHFREYETKLRETATVVVDHTYQVDWFSK